MSGDGVNQFAKRCQPVHLSRQRGLSLDERTHGLSQDFFSSHFSLVVCHLSSTMTGVWSEGRSQARGVLSIAALRVRLASDSVTQM